MSLMAKQFGLKVFYTEKNAGIVNLLNFLKDNKIPDDWIRWIDRDEFKKCLGKDDPFSVFVSVVWSFGNNRQAYLFGKDIEKHKRLCFETVVHNDAEAFAELNKFFGGKLRMPRGKDVRVRRIELARQIKKEQGRVASVERLEQIDRLAKFQSLNQIECCSRLQQLEYPYEEVIIYCDPPYRGTAEYTDNDFDPNEFDGWVRKLKYDVFISEYDCPFEKIASFGKLSLLNNSKEVKKTIQENLYFHKGAVA